MSHLLTLALALALASCEKNPTGPDTPDGPDTARLVHLSAETGYRTEPQTRTEYSGFDETGDQVVNKDSQYERIDWVAGYDRIRVLCAQSAGATSADYLVGTPTADHEKSVAGASEVSGTGPLKWSTNHSQQHYFLAMYPAPGTTSNYHEGAVSETDAVIEPSGSAGNKAVITGSIPSAQPAAKAESSTVYKPNMNRAYMYSTLKTTYVEEGITLPFYPLMTAMEFMLIASDDVMADFDLLSLELSSASTDLAGGFTATIDGTDGSKSISETSGGTKKVTVTLPAGTRLSKGSYTTITVLALGIDQTDLSLRLNFAGNHARTLDLKNKSNQWITVHACKKAYFKLGVPSEEIFFEVTPVTTFAAGGSGAVTRGLDPIDNSDDVNHGFIPQRYGVFAIRNGEGVDFDEANNPANFFLENRDVEYLETFTNHNTYWHGNAPAYWPFYNKLNFFAYAPYQAQVQPTTAGTPSLVMPSEDYGTGMLRGTFTPLENVTKQIDLCLATPALNRVMGPTMGNNVPFTFKHALTNVRLYVRAIGTPMPTYKYQVTEFTLSGLLGTNSFTYQNDADAPFVWDALAAGATLDASYQLTYDATQLTLTGLNFVDESSPTVPENYTHVNAPDNGRLYLLPQTVTSEAQATIYVSFLKQVGETYTLQSILPPFDVPLPTVAWEPGKIVSYLITLDLSRLVVLDIKAMVSEWQSAGNTHTPQIIF